MTYTELKKKLNIQYKANNFDPWNRGVHTFLAFMSEGPSYKIYKESLGESNPYMTAQDAFRMLYADGRTYNSAYDRERFIQGWQYVQALYKKEILRLEVSI